MPNPHEIDVGNVDRGVAPLNGPGAPVGAPRPLKERRSTTRQPFASVFFAETNGRGNIHRRGYIVANSGAAQNLNASVGAHINSSGVVHAQSASWVSGAQDYWTTHR
jgi:hypothetical protein